MMRRRIWHYTYTDALLGMLKDGFIRPATGLIGHGERPIVWFSKEQFWEPTVTKGIRLTDGSIADLGMSELHSNGFGLFRIGVDPSTAPLTWSDIRRESGMEPTTATALSQIARLRGGNPSNWRGTFQPVPISKWEIIECFDGFDWKALDDPETEAHQPEEVQAA